MNRYFLSESTILSAIWIDVALRRYEQKIGVIYNISGLKQIGQLYNIEKYWSHDD